MTVVVQDGLLPQPGVRVVFQASDGTLVSTGMTDANGLATASMPNGGNLTVIRSYANATPPMPDEVYTYVGVKEGDHLQLGKEVSAVPPTTTINVLVPVNAQGTVNVMSPCGSGQGNPPMVPVLVAGCGSTVDFYVEDDRASFIASAPYGTMIDFSQHILSDGLNETFSSTNVGTGVTVAVEESLLLDDYKVYSSGPQQVEATAANVRMPNVHGPDGLTAATIVGTAGTEMVAHRTTYVPSPVTIDATAGLIPYVTAPTFSPTQVSWTEQGPGTADAVLVVMSVGDKYTRAIVAAHTGSSLAIPQLPGTDATYNPTAADQITGAHGLIAVTGGYDAIRGRALSVANVVEATPANGSLTLSYTGVAPVAQ